MTIGLGDVIGVLLDPPTMGRVSLVDERDGEVTNYEAAFVAADESLQRAVQWRCSDGRSTRMAQDGVIRSFVGDDLIESGAGRADYVIPVLHLVFPLKAYIWGRPQDDWRMTTDVRSDGNLAVVRLVNVEHPDVDGRLIVDMERRLAISYERPTSRLSLADFKGGPPGVSFDRP